jgi:hypothetical protein
VAGAVGVHSMLITRIVGTLSSIFWRAGALFAILLALFVSGATVLVLICLLMLANLTENWPGDAFGQVLVQRAVIGQAVKPEFWPDANANLRWTPHIFLRGSELSNAHSADPRQMVNS